MTNLIKRLNDLKIDVPSYIQEIQIGVKNELMGSKLIVKNIPQAILNINHLNKFNEMPKDDGFEIKGTMVDVSRNAVFKLDYFKDVIKKQAYLGFNEIWIYMEDIYDLKNYKKFGYLRGKYSLNDMIELDEYAISLGVTLVPCIQTLGHMGQFLRWPSSSDFKDQSDVLLIGQSSSIIKDMLDFCQKAFKTDKIHVGMDETFGFGFGQYHKKFGYETPENLFMKHLLDVNRLVNETKFKKMYIWSDMFFRNQNKDDYYYDSTIEFSDFMKENLPSNVGLVYWDYYNHKEEVYEKMILKHQELNREVIMASGTWIWTKLYYDRSKTLNTATHAINASKKHGINSIVFTQWQDDGAYCDYESSYLGLYDVTNVMSNNTVNIKILEDILLDDVNHLNNYPKLNDLGYNPIQLLWDDCLLGIYLNDLAGYDSKKLALYVRKTKKYLNLIKDSKNNHLIHVSNVMYLKLQLRQQLLSAYFNTKDFVQTIKTAKKLIKAIKLLNESFTNMWHERFKVFGLEVLQNRIYAQIERVNELLRTIDAYENKKVDKIEYLEEELSKEPWLSNKYIEIALSSKQ